MRENASWAWYWHGNSYYDCPTISTTVPLSQLCSQCMGCLPPLIWEYCTQRRDLNLWFLMYAWKRSSLQGQLLAFRPVVHPSAKPTYYMLRWEPLLPHLISIAKSRHWQTKNIFKPTKLVKSIDRTSKDKIDHKVWVLVTKAAMQTGGMWAGQHKTNTVYTHIQADPHKTAPK